MIGKAKIATFFIAIVLVGLLSGCSLVKSYRQPPLQIIPDMDDQPKYKPQAEGSFFADRRTSRLPVPGTVPHGKKKTNFAFYADKEINRDDETFYNGKAGDYWSQDNPLPMSAEILKRGQERYNITCANCHDRAGTGQGIVFVRAQNLGQLPPTNLHDDRIRTMPDGQIFNTITNGIRNMSGLGHQIAPEDRWAIIRYIRALQRSQNATINDVPVEQQGNLK
ncbi:MAG: cytochrome c [Blastocatellia bacterium]|nr:cytochrome c [Blastocatellia bacterium]